MEPIIHHYLQRPESVFVHGNYLLVAPAIL